jgi:hypothetical protein
MTDQSPNSLPMADVNQTEHRSTSRLSRGRFAAATVIAPVAGLGLVRSLAHAQDITSTGVGDTPTTGGMRPGPGGMAPEPLVRNRGVVPVAFRIDRFGVDAPVELKEIVDGVMENPSGPWVVSWYQETARLGEIGNVVVAGHVDYWNVGPAVFYGLKDPGMAEGDQIAIAGENGAMYIFETEYSRQYTIDELTPETIQNEIVEQTDTQALTLITCGGTFDPVAGEYLSRIVVRAHQVDVQSPA